MERPRVTGDAIPPASRILLVADAYDAMTTDRPYREAMTPDAALTELRTWSGKVAALPVHPSSVLRYAAVAEVEAEQVGVGRREPVEVVFVKFALTGTRRARPRECMTPPIADDRPRDARLPRDFAVVQSVGDELLDSSQLSARAHGFAN